MAANDDHPMRVVFPPDEFVKGIEIALMMRPDKMNRNWLPGETISDLIKENQRKIKQKWSYNYFVIIIWLAWSKDLLLLCHVAKFQNSNFVIRSKMQQKF